jgi:hypothetical protein
MLIRGTGCSQCRAKKIKCDEAKPFCSRCVRSGWECSGYQPSVGSKSSNLFLTFAIAGKGPPSRTLPGFIPSVLRGSSSSRGDKGLLLLGRQRYVSLLVPQHQSHSLMSPGHCLILLQDLRRWNPRTSTLPKTSRGKCRMQSSNRHGVFPCKRQYVFSW